MNDRDLLVLPEGERTVPLVWMPVPDTLPPNPDKFFSPRAWLALSDGRVKVGCWCHRTDGSSHGSPVHCWFVDNEELDEGVTVVAWMPYAVPDHPRLSVTLSTHAIAQQEQPQ